MIFFEHKEIDTNSSVFEFRATENNQVLGECTLVLFPKYAEVTKVSFSDNKIFIVEGLLKAAFNLAANRGYYIGRCSAENVTFCLARMNFSKTEKGYENDIPSILMGSCGGCCK